MSFQFLVLEACPSGVLHVAMNRAPANGVDRAMYIELRDLFADPDAHLTDVRVIVLCGAGKHFCAGNDLDEFATMTPQNGTERMWRVREAFFAIQDCPVPVIGAVHGVALGTGLAIAASCDFVVAAKDARFGLPEVTVGVFGGARHLARIAPEPLVRRMFFTGEHMDAATLVANGGSVFLTEPADLRQTAHGFAERIAAHSPTGVRLGKHVLNRIEEMPLKAGYEYEQGFTVKASGHPDAKEALAAFRDRRPPDYAPRSAEWTLALPTKDSGTA
jgi:enoyl-CoA hydratase/carnithine racemase